MAQIQQWMVLCTMCDGPAHHHCNTCGDILCSKCKDMHLKSKATRNHHVVPYSERVDPAQISGLCEAHPELECRLWCKTCDKTACVECVTSDDHRGHIFIKLAAKLEEKREIMKQDYEKKTATLKIWELSLKDFQSTKDEFDSDVAKQDKFIKERAEEICCDARKIESQKRHKLREIQDSAHEMFEEKEKILSDSTQEIREDCAKLEARLRSNDTSSILQYVPEKGDQKKVPPDFVPLESPIFSPGPLRLHDLSDSFGRIKYEQDKVIKTDDAGTHSSDAHFLPEPVVVNTIDSGGKGDPIVACAGSDQAWIARDDDETICLMSRTGEVKRIINVQASSCSVTEKGELVITSEKDMSVIIVSDNGEIRVLFKTGEEPLSHFCRRGGDIVLVFKAGKIVVYQEVGKVVKEMDKSLFKHPAVVTENKVNFNLYVSDWLKEKTEDAVQSRGKILAFDNNLKLKFTYTGVDISGFTPCGLCSDQFGNIIIADLMFNRIHILDKNGQFLRYLLKLEQGILMPFKVDVDDEGCAWIGEVGRNKVKIVRYIDKPN